MASVTFTVASGPGKLLATHNGDPADLTPANAATQPAYHGLARAYIRSSVDHASAVEHRRRLLEVDMDSGQKGSTVVVDPDAQEQAPLSDIVVKATLVGSSATATLTIPVTADMAQTAVNSASP